MEQEQQTQTETQSRTQIDPEQKQKTMIPEDEFIHVKNDLHKFKDRARQLEEELNGLKEKDMQAKEQWKEFGEAKQQEAENWKAKYESLSTSIQESAKVSKVREAAIKLGLLESAVDDLELMDLKDVVVETTSTGKVNVIGAKSAAERIKAARPHWFQEKKAPTVNGQTPTVTTSASGELNYEKLKKLEKEAKDSGDYTEYTKAVKEFKLQGRNKN